ncbi:MAG: hypothetical protein KDB14_23445 [Planctomycetales bacterium]|nr:hypothetical protein [Planctomycetales bacterium]
MRSLLWMTLDAVLPKSWTMPLARQMTLHVRRALAELFCVLPRKPQSQLQLQSTADCGCATG